MNINTLVKSKVRRLRKETEDEFYFLGPFGNKMKTNTIGARIIILSDGTKTVEEITQSLCSIYKIPFDTAISDVVEFVRQGKKANLYE